MRRRTVEFCIVFYLSETWHKACKPHGTPSTWSLEDQEFYMSFSLEDSHSYPGKSILAKRFSQWHTRNIPALNNTEQWHWDIQSTAWQRDFYEILTRSLRDLGFAREGRRARQQGKALYAALLLSTLPSWPPTLLYSTLLYYSTLPHWPLYSSRLCSTLFSSLFYSSLLCSTPLESLLLFNSILFFTLLYIVSSTVLSFFVSQANYWEAIPKSEYCLKECVWKTQVPLQSVRKINATNNWFTPKEWHVYHGLPYGTPFVAQEDNRGTSYHPDPVPPF